MTMMPTNTTPNSCAPAPNVLQQLLGVDLRRLRKDHGMTAVALAARVGVSESGLCRWENGNRGPRLPTLVRLAEVVRQLQGAGAA